MCALNYVIFDQVLADMDDSVVAVLPQDLATEAQTLRRELEERHRRILQQRLFTEAGFGGRQGNALFWQQGKTYCHLENVANVHCS